MHPKVKRVWKACLKDEEFHKMLKLGDDDPKPHRFMLNNVKVIYASYYYGWLLARHGTDWDRYI